jgi:hypothetical protein
MKPNQDRPHMALYLLLLAIQICEAIVRHANLVLVSPAPHSDSGSAFEHLLNHVFLFLGRLSFILAARYFRSSCSGIFRSSGAIPTAC